MVLVLQLCFTVNFSLPIHVLNILGADGSRFCDLENTDAVATMKIGEAYKLEGLLGPYKFFDSTLKRYKIYW